MNKTVKALLASALAIPGMASAAPVLNPGNGHYYEFVGGQVTWQTALASAATATPIAGFTAHLATVTSLSEANFIFNSISSGGNWFAGTDEAAEGVWRWAAGPEAGQIFWNGLANGSSPPGAFANWHPGEPNNCCGGENYLHNFGGLTTWNDLRTNDLGFISGYVVEYSANGAVPEPATWAMMLAGFGLVGGAMRRKVRTTVRFA